jgi:hypothetical protein
MKPYGGCESGIEGGFKFQEPFLGNSPHDPLRHAREQMHQAGGGGCQGGDELDGRAAWVGEMNGRKTYFASQITRNSEKSLASVKEARARATIHMGAFPFYAGGITCLSVGAENAARGSRDRGTNTFAGA